MDRFLISVNSYPTQMTAYLSQPITHPNSTNHSHIQIFLAPKEKNLISMDQTNKASKTSQMVLQKKEPNQQQLIPGLPDEIAMECLVRVPYQFHSNVKSVCHTWHDIVTNPSFYKERRKSNHAEQLIFLVQPLPTLNSSTDQTLITSDTIKNQETEHVQDQENQQKHSHSPPQYGLTIFNITNNTWHRTGPKDCCTVPLFSQCLALPESGKVLLLGGWDRQTWEPVPHVYILELIGGSYKWKLGASMSVARSFFACAAVGSSRVYVAGGHDSQKNALKSAEVYDVELDEWKILPDMSEERDECQGLAWENDSRFWVVSGYGTESQGQFRSDAEYYDPGTNSWSQVNQVWPFPGTSPRSGTTTACVNKKQNQWLWFMGNSDQEINNNHVGMCQNWETISSILVPNSEIGISPCVTTLGCCDQDKQKIFVMSGGGRRSSLASSSFLCRDCEGEAFILERCGSNGSTKWNHIHTPKGFSGFPYSACNLTI